MPSLSEEMGPRNSLGAFNPTDPRLVLIDFEYASYNYRGFDFANHFVEFSINYDVDVPPYYELIPHKFPTHAQMFDFMLSYLKELHPSALDSSLHTQAEAMVKETIPFIPISSFFWVNFLNILPRLHVNFVFQGVWGLLQGMKQINRDSFFKLF